MVKIGLMSGKRGLVMGVANDHSIAWGVAKALADQGAELAFTYQGEALGKRVKPLAGSVGSSLVLPCDVEDIASVDAVFEALKAQWGAIDFLVHCIAYSDRSELKGRYADTTRENFMRTMVISAFSFTEIAKRAAALMPNGGAMATLTFGGATRVMPNYNVMGVAKAALEASVRYLAADFGPAGIRVNAISAGPIRTLAGAGIADARFMFSFQRDHSPLRRTVTIEDVGGAALYLLSNLSSGVTGEVHFVDAGYNIISMPRPEDIKSDGKRRRRIWPPNERRRDEKRSSKDHGNFFVNAAIVGSARNLREGTAMSRLETTVAIPFCARRATWLGCILSILAALLIGSSLRRPFWRPQKRRPRQTLVAHAFQAFRRKPLAAGRGARRLASDTSISPSRA